MATNRNTKSEVVSTVEDLIVNGVISAFQKRESWTGTMTQLGSILTKKSSKGQKQMMPGSPSALRVALNRTIRRLRARGVSVRFSRSTDSMRTRFVKFVF